MRSGNEVRDELRTRILEGSWSLLATALLAFSPLGRFVRNSLSSWQTRKPSRETPLGIRPGSPDSRKKAGTRTKVSANTVWPRAKTKAFLRMSKQKTLPRSRARISSVFYSISVWHTGLNHPCATVRAQGLQVSERVETGVSQTDPKTNGRKALRGLTTWDLQSWDLGSQVGQW